MATWQHEPCLLFTAQFSKLLSGPCFCLQSTGTKVTAFGHFFCFFSRPPSPPSPPPCLSSPSYRFTFTFTYTYSMAHDVVQKKAVPGAVMYFVVNSSYFEVLLTVINISSIIILLYRGTDSITITEFWWPTICRVFFFFFYQIHPTEKK